MRPGQNKRSRGRSGGGGGGNPNNPNRPRMPHRNQTFDSNGPNVKIRGNAYQVFERYIALAREAASSGDRIAAENLYQHAEHYYRIMNANGEGQGNPMNPRPMTPADNEMNAGDADQGDQQGQGQPPYQQRGGQHRHEHGQPRHDGGQAHQQRQDQQHRHAPPSPPVDASPGAQEPAEPDQSSQSSVQPPPTPSQQAF